MTSNTAQSLGSTLRERLADRVRRLGLYFALLVALLIAAIVAPEFFQVSNLLNVSRQTSVLAIVSLGQLLVLLVAGVDLSVGSVMTTTTVVAGQITLGDNSRLPGAIAVCLLIGLAIAVLNLFLIVNRNVPPFLATLGTLTLLEGARLLYTNGVPQGAPTSFIRYIGSGTVRGVPIATMIAVLLLAAGSLVLRRSKFGRMLYASGSNREAARLSGVPVNLVVASCYISCSLLAVLAGLIQGGYLGYSDAYLGRGFEFDSITGAIVGGASFAGGIGTVEGTVAGIILTTVLSNILYIRNINVQLQFVLKGMVILAAVGYYSSTRGSH